MQRILIIEDEVKTAHSIRKGLKEKQYDTDIAFDGIVGKNLALKNNYDLIISDIILPGISGIELCRQLRELGIGTPILMLTALGEVDDKVEGLDSGADDYLTKPFEFKELLARIRVLLKRHAHSTSDEHHLTVADLQLNLYTKKANREGKEIDLTAKEFALLEYFMRNAGRVLSKMQIAEHVWGIDFDTGTNIVEVYVNYLRKKIGKDSSKKLIHTEIGMGYIMKEK